MASIRSTLDRSQGWSRTHTSGPSTERLSSAACWLFVKNFSSMKGYVLRRLAQAVPLLFLISVLAFLLVRASGDPMSIYGAGANLSADDRARVVALHGWDKPKIVQYFYWLSDVVRGDWGTSVYTHQAVTQMILDRLPNTLILMGSGFLVPLLIAIPLGVASAVRPNSILDNVATACTFSAFALHAF